MPDPPWHDNDEKCKIPEAKIYLTNIKIENSINIKINQAQKNMLGTKRPVISKYRVSEENSSKKGKKRACGIYETA